MLSKQRVADKRWLAVLATAVGVGFGSLAPALSIHAANDPKDQLRTAVESTRQVRSIFAEGHTVGNTPSPRGTDVVWKASLAGTDSDVTVQTSATSIRTVAVGDKVYQQTPVGGAAGWQVANRAPVADDTTPGTGLLALSFPDGRSAGDPSLYRSVINTSAPAAAMPLPGLQVGAVASAQATGSNQTLIADLDMVQVGLALRVGAADQSRVAQWQGTLTVSVGPDGRMVRQQLTLHGPSPAPGQPAFDLTHDVSYSQFNTASVAAPVQP